MTDADRLRAEAEDLMTRSFGRDGFVYDDDRSAARRQLAMCKLLLALVNRLEELHATVDLRLSDIVQALSTDSGDGTSSPVTDRRR